MITASVHPRQLEPRTWQQELAPAIMSPEELAADASLEEILSGGDPLSLSNARLENLTRELAATPHVRRVRMSAPSRSLSCPPQPVGAAR